MAVLRWDPWADFAALQRDINEVFSRTGQNGRMPLPMDAYRTEEGVIVHLDLPGVVPGDVDVAVSDGTLTVTAERKPLAGVADDAWLRRERGAGLLQRSFSLPEGTDPDAISASFEHGVLQLHIPHPPQRKPRRIPVGEGSQNRQTEMVDVTGETVSS